jgi:perosamine synthetase
VIPKSRPDLKLQDIISALNLGEAKADFESAVAKLAGARYGLSFSFAHAGFLALLKALNLTNAEVILPSYTSQVMAEAIYATGNIPVFVDIDLEDYNMDLDEIRKAITPQTRMIVATRIYGTPMSIPAIREVASSDKIFIVEDCAMAFPGTALGPQGLESDAALFSLGPGKPLFTVRGGVVVTKDGDLLGRLASVRRKEMDSMTRQEWYKRWMLLGTHYVLTNRLVTNMALGRGLSRESVVGVGRQVGVLKEKAQVFEEAELPNGWDAFYTNFQAHVGLSQLRKADSMLLQRQAQAALYNELLNGTPGIVLPPTREGSSFSHYTIRVPSRDAIRFRERLMEAGIETGRTFSYVLGSIPTRPYGKGFYPRADQASREVVNLPICLSLTREQSHMIVDEVRRILYGSYSTMRLRGRYVSTNNYAEAVRNGRATVSSEVGDLAVSNLNDHGTPLLRYSTGVL